MLNACSLGWSCQQLVPIMQAITDNAEADNLAVSA